MLYDVNTGEFTYTIGSDKLSVGLRKVKGNQKNNGYLVSCIGAVGKDSILQAVEEFNKIDTNIIMDVFPYPQIFVFINIIIVCGRSTIYEYVDGVLYEQLTVTPGYLWSAVDFYDYVYMTNGVCSVVRNSANKEFELTTDLPFGTSVCNFNGQIILGAPNAR